MLLSKNKFLCLKQLEIHPEDNNFRTKKNILKVLSNRMRVCQ